MYTNFIKNFNKFFGKKGNILFSIILIIFSILLMLSSLYAFRNITIRNNKYIEKYVLFEQGKAFIIEQNGKEEVTFLSYNNGDALNPYDYEGKVLQMFCLKNDHKNCFYVKTVYNYNYVSLGLSVSIVLLTLGIVCRKLYKVRNTNHGSIKTLRPFFITLFLFGAYLFTNQTYNLVHYMRFQTKMNKIEGTIIGKYKNKNLVEYIIEDKHYSTLSKTNTIKYNKNKPYISYEKSNFNILELLIGITISYTSIMIITLEKDIDKKIKINEKKTKKENYRRKK